MTQYFIFGGTGFIGTHLTNLLNEAHPECKVYNLDVVEPSQIDKAIADKVASWATVKDYKPAIKQGQTLGSTFIRCDVRQPIVLPESVKPTTDDVIFNFAAIHRTPGHPDKDYFETNIRGAENITAFAEKHGIKKIVFTSSIAPYGAAEEEKFEDTLPTPNTPYGISKLVAEKIHIIWANGGAVNELNELNEGVKEISHNSRNSLTKRHLLIVRPGVVFGKGENGNFTRLYWAIRNGKFAYPGRKDTIKACIYVKELVRFMLYKIENEVTQISQINADDNLASPNNPKKNISENQRNQRDNYIYNCCYEPAYTIEHICEAMKKVTGLKRHILDIPNWLIMPAAAIIGALGAPMGICPARVKKLQISTNICGKKLSESGYPFKWTFEEALNDWFEDNDRQVLQ